MNLFYNLNVLLSPGHACLFQRYLSECQIYLEAVPAMFRLELLENIFSLLFLSDGDFIHQTEPCDPKQFTDSVTQNGAFAEVEQQNTSNNQLKEDSSAKTEPNEQWKRAGEPGTKESRWDFNLSHPFPELSHLISGCRGFLLDACGMEGILRLVREGLEGVCALGQEDGRALGAEAELSESLGCSVTVDTFSARLQRLSKRTAEAHWRLQIITSNQSNGMGELGQFTVCVLLYINSKSV